ncbi:MAG: alpha/beta fold hydrolase [Patescibacteria group bacterium]
MATKPLVYILHGWAVDKTNQQKWQPFISALARRGVTAKFLPIPGLSTDLSEVWNLQDFVDWFKKQLEKDGVRAEANVLGHSFGGQMAIRAAAQSPQLFSKIVLIDSSGIRDHSLSAKSKRALFLILAKIGRILMPFSFARQLLHKLARERDYLNAPPVMRRAMSLVVNDEVRQDLPKITCPTLIIWGENDKVTPLKNGRLKRQQIKNSQLEIISEARHSPQFTHTEQTADLVANFLLKGEHD